MSKKSTDWYGKRILQHWRAMVIEKIIFIIHHYKYQSLFNIFRMKASVVERFIHTLKICGRCLHLTISDTISGSMRCRSLYQIIIRASIERSICDPSTLFSLKNFWPRYTATSDRESGEIQNRCMWANLKLSSRRVIHQIGPKCLKSLKCSILIL